jgi:hypothetical protein
VSGITEAGERRRLGDARHVEAWAVCVEWPDDVGGSDHVPDPHPCEGESLGEGAQGEDTSMVEVEFVHGGVPELPRREVVVGLVDGDRDVFRHLGDQRRHLLAGEMDTGGVARVVDHDQLRAVGDLSEHRLDVTFVPRVGATRRAAVLHLDVGGTRVLGSEAVDDEGMRERQDLVARSAQVRDQVHQQCRRPVGNGHLLEGAALVLSEGASQLGRLVVGVAVSLRQSSLHHLEGRRGRPEG